MLRGGDTKWPEDVPTAEGNLAFAAFTLSHTPCGDGVIEARLGEGLLLQWCLDCAEMRVFRSSGV